MHPVGEWQFAAAMWREHGGEVCLGRGGGGGRSERDVDLLVGGDEEVGADLFGGEHEAAGHFVAHSKLFLGGPGEPAQLPGRSVLAAVSLSRRSSGAGGRQEVGGDEFPGEAGLERLVVLKGAHVVGLRAFEDDGHGGGQSGARSPSLPGGEGCEK